MDHDSHMISVEGWQAQWLQRDLKGLVLETQTVGLVVVGIALVEALVTLYYNICAHRDVKRNPSDRAAIVAENDKRTRKPNHVSFFLSYTCLFHALGIWLVDAGISIFTIAQDVDSNPGRYDTNMWLDLAISMVVMLGIFSSVFILFPALQMVAVGYAISRHYRRDAHGTLAAYIHPLRHASTRIAFFWSMSAFMIVGWWPVFENTTVRVILLEAIIGSASTWLHASYLFTFKGHDIEHVEVQKITGISEGLKLYGRQVYVVHSGKAEAGLPVHEAANETAPLLNEKSSA